MADKWPDNAAIEAAVQLSVATELRAEDALRYLEEGWTEPQIRAAYEEAQRRGCALCESSWSGGNCADPARFRAAGDSHAAPVWNLAPN